MRTAAIIELKVAREACSCRGDRFIDMEIHLFVFHRSPEPFNKNIIAPRASPIHTQANPVGLDESGKCVIRKLTALIRIHDVWVPIPSQGLLNSLKAELDVQRDGLGAYANPLPRRDTQTPWPGECT